MKIFLFFVLIIAFLMFYQKDPVFTIVIVLIFLALYLFVKARKKRRIEGRGGFFKGSGFAHSGRMDDLLTLILVLKLTEPGAKNNFDELYQDISDEREDKIEKTKKQVLELLQN